MKISIITPCFNSEKTIERTILSVLSQSYKDIEYIIVDGASKDKTMDIVNKYRDRISYIISEPDKGISDAYNKGIKVATGELIGIVASNDELLIDAIDKLVRVYDGKSDVVSGGQIKKDSLGYLFESSDPDIKELRKRTSLIHPATYIKKSAYEKYGGYSLKYRSAIDRELLLRFHIEGATFQIINEYLSLFNGGGISEIKPYKYSYLEDRRISIEYGLPKIMASIIWLKLTTKYFLSSGFKVISKPVDGWAKLKKRRRNYLDDEVVKVLINNFEDIDNSKSW